MTPAESADAMRKAQENPRTGERDLDPEGCHARMDDVLVQIAREHGHEEAVAIFIAQEKWYA